MAAQSKPELIESLSLGIERGALGEQDGCEAARQPGANFRVAELCPGTVAVRCDALHRAQGRHDDCVIATALAWRLARIQPVLLPFILDW